MEESIKEKSRRRSWDLSHKKSCWGEKKAMVVHLGWAELWHSAISGRTGLIGWHDLENNDWFGPI